MIIQSSCKQVVDTRDHKTGQKVEKDCGKRPQSNANNQAEAFVNEAISIVNDRMYRPAWSVEIAEHLTVPSKKCIEEQLDNIFPNILSLSMCHGTKYESRFSFFLLSRKTHRY